LVRWGETVSKTYSNVASAFVDDVRPETSISVSVLGRLGHFDLKFTGSLRATYDDGSTITRFVSGVLKLKKFLDVGVAYGLAKSMKDGQDHRDKFSHDVNSKQQYVDDVHRLSEFAEIEAEKISKNVLGSKRTSTDGAWEGSSSSSSTTTEQTLPTWKVRWQEKRTEKTETASSSSQQEVRLSLCNSMKDPRLHTFFFSFGGIKTKKLKQSRLT
jgi:hypothetical protein